MFIKRLNLKKILSFNDAEIKLGPLNVLIGPNAVGKSNLIEVIGLLQAAPNSLWTAMLRGGVRQWLWLGDALASPVASIECELNLPRGRQAGALLYNVSFSEQSSALIIHSEKLTKSGPRSGKALTYFDRPSTSQAELGSDNGGGGECEGGEFAAR